MKPVKVFPLLLMLGLLAVMVAVDQLFPSLRLNSALLRWLGAPLLGTGLTVVFAAAGLFRRRGTTLHPYGESAALVQDGLYRYSRNPMYLGMLLVLTGVALGLGQPAAVAALPVFVAVVSSRNIRREEQMLEERFGDAYRAYRQRVRRWI